MSGATTYVIIQLNLSAIVVFRLGLYFCYTSLVEINNLIDSLWLLTLNGIVENLQIH